MTRKRTEPTTGLIDRIRRHMRENGMAELLSGHRRAGIALSGGPDSMALLHIAVALGWEPVAMHCNFGLRGRESDRDEAFVTEACARAGVMLVKTRFDVKERMRQTGESTEMACRELRYGWFSQTARELGLEEVALGHHRDDNTETFLLNALRGCGTGGAKGIPPRRGIYIRPLLCLSRKEILDYLSREGIGYVTDSTNAENDYTRNKIRNIILPAIEESFPGGSRKLDTTARNIARDNRLLRSLVEEKRQRYLKEDGSVAVKELFDNEKEAPTLLYHLLDGDLDFEAVLKISETIGSSGKFHHGRAGGRYLLDRGLLIPVRESAIPSPTAPLVIDKELIREEREAHIPLPWGNLAIHARLIPRRDFSPKRNPDFAWFAPALLDHPAPLTVRPPRTGDRMTPFGMKGSRLLSDIFSDAKLSILEKERQPVVCLGKKVAWLPGLRNSSLFPVDSRSENILELHMLNVAKKS